jgi:hypothetical protein
MAIDYQDKIDKPTIKYGAAEQLVFGTPRQDQFDILESLTCTQNFGTDMQVKNEAGLTVGTVLGDPKVDISMTGYGNKDNAPFKLGDSEASIEMYVTEVFEPGASNSGGDGPSGGSLEDLTVCIKSVQQDNSNEDFMKFTVTAEHYYNLDYSKSAILKEEDGAFDGQ